MTGPARSILDWSESNGAWTAVGPTGTHWEIHDTGIGKTGRFGIIVEHWDHPDWWADSLEAAKALAAEIDARPPISASEQIVDQPVMPEDTSDVPVETTAAPPTEHCECGSGEPPLSVKPAPGTPDFWDDPAPFWKCPTCGTYRGEIERDLY